MKSKTILLSRKRKHLLLSFKHSVNTRRQKPTVKECTRLLDGSTGKLVDVWHMSYEKLVGLPDNKPSANASHARIQGSQQKHATLELGHVARRDVQLVVARVWVARARAAPSRALVLNEVNLVAALAPQQSIWAEPEKRLCGVSEVRRVCKLALVPNLCQKCDECLLGVLFVERAPLRKGITVEAIAHGVGFCLYKRLGIFACACQV